MAPNEITTNKTKTKAEQKTLSRLNFCLFFASLKSNARIGPQNEKRDHW